MKKLRRRIHRAQRRAKRATDTGLTYIEVRAGKGPR